jgi:tetratricopeptide (TPR) repeat protein
MDASLAQEAIDAALTGEWQQAIDLNSQILKILPDDIDALNRIARAYAENGNLAKAKETTNKVLKLDALNPIANRCFEKWKTFKNHSNGTVSKISPDIFIENLAKTKAINLINLGGTENFLSLDCGDRLKLVGNSHRISVHLLDGSYVGRFPDDLSAKYIKLMKNGNSYDAVIKTTNKSQVKILVKNAS